MEGLLLINKPQGITSHDVVDIARRKLKIKKIGHAGTLDPLATGLLILLVGKSTKLSNEFMGFDKAYRSTLMLGKKTDTADIEGEIINQRNYQDINDQQIRTVFNSFLGRIDQLPPMFSAVKVKGKKLYEYARKGILVEREPREVEIFELNVEDIKLPYVQFYMKCSKGTYVRQLADDIGDQLGCGACISQIERTQIGKFNLKDAISIEEIDESYLQCWQYEESFQ